MGHTAASAARGIASRLVARMMFAGGRQFENAGERCQPHVFMLPVDGSAPRCLSSL